MIYYVAEVDSACFFQIGQPQVTSTSISPQGLFSNMFLSLLLL